MHEANQPQANDLCQPHKPLPNAKKRVIWRMIQSSANDNMMPTTTWFAWLVFWTIMVGGLLAWVIL
jgi:hypothetical protein